MGEVHNALVVALDRVLVHEVRVERRRVLGQRAELVIREDGVAQHARVVVERAVGGHPAVLRPGVRSSWPAGPAGMTGRFSAAAAARSASSRTASAGRWTVGADRPDGTTATVTPAAKP